MWSVYFQLTKQQLALNVGVSNIEDVHYDQMCVCNW